MSGGAATASGGAKEALPVERKLAMSLEDISKKTPKPKKQRKGVKAPKEASEKGKAEGKREATREKRQQKQDDRRGKPQQKGANKGGNKNNNNNNNGNKNRDGGKGGNKAKDGKGKNDDLPRIVIRADLSKVEGGGRPSQQQPQKKTQIRLH